MTLHDTPTRACFIAAFALGCGTKYAQTATQPEEILSDASTDVPACGSTLASRLAITTIDVDEDIRYKREGYNGFPTDARLAFGVAPSGNSYVAWTNNAFTTVHVTPLNGLQSRLGPDTRVPGYDIGGLVAQNDGFALLLQTDDPGTPLVNPNPNAPGLSAMVVRYRQGSVAYLSALTGTKSIVNAAAPLRDCTPERFDGRLAYNGTKYGAYFTVHGCVGDAHESYYADKLAYFDDQGRPVTGGWNWGCQINQDLRLLPEPGAFTSLCITDTNDATNVGGLNLIEEGSPDITRIVDEFAVANACTAQFGTVIKLADASYVAIWLSRGGSNSEGTLPAKPANDIALIHLNPAPDYTPSAVISVTNTPSVHEVNLHAAAYGPERILVSWDSIENFKCSNDYNITCLGQYTGTHFQLIDNQGNAVGPDETLPAPPNERDDMVAFPNGDVGWAFVPDPGRQYSMTYAPGVVSQLAAIRQIGVARMLYCP